MVPLAPPKQLMTATGPIRLPVFVPDATRGVIRGVSPDQLRAVGVESLIVSTAHLVFQPGASVVRALGGLQRFTGWSGQIFSDSGGFQAFSLMGQGLCKASNQGLVYRFSPTQKYRRLTPRTCIEAQFRMGADVIYCLDYCTSPQGARPDQERSVELTVKWAKECRATFDSLVDRRDTPRPLLFAVVQGGPFEDLRSRCAEELAALGFDGFGFGGYPVVDGGLVDEVLYLPELVPGAFLHGLGIGTPEHIVTAWRAGFDVFDCVLPTRNGRRGVLYYGLPDGPIGPGRCSSVARLADERWVRERGPIDPECDCLACTQFSAGYLSHLFRIDDRLVHTLGSLHNLRFYSRLLERLRSMEGRRS